MARTKFSIKVLGTKKTSAYLRAKNIDIKKAVNDGIEEGTKILKEEVEGSIAGQRAEPRSVDTGNFLSSVDSETKGSEGRVYSDVPYSIFLEFGTSKIQQRRHFNNSLDRKKGEIIRAIREKID